MDKKSYIDMSDTTKYILNLGAIIEPVNFMPLTRAQAAVQKDSSKAMMALFVGAVVISAILIVVPYIQLVPIQNDLKTVNKQIEQLEPIEDTVNEYYRAKDMYTDAENFKSLTSSNDDSLEDFLADVETNIPSDVAFVSVSINNGAVTLTGTASSKESVAKLIDVMRNTKNVYGVTVGSEAESKDSVGIITVAFSMSFNIVAGE